MSYPEAKYSLGHQFSTSILAIAKAKGGWSVLPVRLDKQRDETKDKMLLPDLSLRKHAD